MSGAETASEKRQARVCLFFNEKIEKITKTLATAEKACYTILVCKSMQINQHTHTERSAVRCRKVDGEACMVEKPEGHYVCYFDQTTA